MQPPLTDDDILLIAERTGLLAGIRLAAACHPDRVPIAEATTPAHTALLQFAHALLNP